MATGTETSAGSPPYTRGDRVRSWLTDASNVVLLGLVIAGVGATAVLDSTGQVFVLKLFAVVFLAGLPGLLYLQFIQVRGTSLYDEYVLNLYRLGIDAVGTLPKPPPGAGLYPRWLAESEGAAPAHNIYLHKFESVYGRKSVPDARRVRDDGGLRQRDHERASWSYRRTTPPFSPVLLLTAAYLVGWAAVLHPELAHEVRFLDGVVLSGLPELPTEALRYGFAGAYAFTLQGLVRRFFDADLKTGAYVSALTRVIYVCLLVAVLGLMLPANRVLAVLAFVVGFFPDVAWQLIRRGVARSVRTAIPAVDPRHPLSDLDGVTVWTQVRLLEEGIEDLENLTTANLVDLMLDTRVPVNRLVDWVDQAFLYLRVTNRESRDRLRECGVRTATDLLDAVQGPHSSGASTTALAAAVRVPPEVLRLLCRSLDGEVNLTHVRRWRRAAWLAEDPPPDRSASTGTGAASDGGPAPAPRTSNGSRRVLLSVFPFRT